MNMETVQSAMQIVLHAGDARVKIFEALKHLREFDIEAARGLLTEARKDIIEAHRIQTVLLQAESAGEETEYSILFSHAQDTCMTVNSEFALAEQLIEMWNALDNRFKALEK